MSRSHLRVYVHFVWATWDREPSIPGRLLPGLHAVIRAVCERRGCQVLAVGGMPDHVHLLVSLPATVTLAELAHDAKGASSRWMNEQAEVLDAFRWQGRYGVFSVSPHERSGIADYIRNQERHHAEGTVWATAEELPADEGHVGGR